MYDSVLENRMQYYYSAIKFYHNIALLYHWGVGEIVAGGGGGGNGVTFMFIATS